MNAKSKLFLGAAILGIATAGAALSIGETGAVKADAAGAVSYTYDFVTNFGSYASSWSTSYGEHIVSSTVLGNDLPAAEVKFGSANKQSSNTAIADRPVSKISDNTFTLDPDTDLQIASFTLVCAQWKELSASFTVSTATGKVLTPSSSDSSAIFEESGITWAVDDIGVQSINFNQTKNNQVGYSKIVVSLEPLETIDSLDHISVSALPTKNEYQVGEAFDPSGISVVGYSGADEESSASFVLSDLTYNPAAGYVFGEEDIGNKEIEVTASYNGQEYKTTFDVNVISGPAISLFFGNDAGHAFPGTADYVSSYNASRDFEGTRTSLIAYATGKYTFKVYDYDDCMTIGSSSKYASGVRFKTGILAANGNVLIERVDLHAASNNNGGHSKLTIKIGDQESDQMSIEGNTEQILSFTPSKESVGSVDIVFTNIYQSINIYGIEVWLKPSSDSDVTAAYSFAHDLELVDSCNSEEYAAILDAYDKLSPAQKKIANEILLDDYIDDMNSRETIGIGSTTVLEKITAIDSRQATGANGSFIPNESTADNTLYIVLGTALGAAALAIAAAVIIKKREAKASK